MVLQLLLARGQNPGPAGFAVDGKFLANVQSDTPWIVIEDNSNVSRFHEVQRSRPPRKNASQTDNSLNEKAQHFNKFGIFMQPSNNTYGQLTFQLLWDSIVSVVTANLSNTRPMKKNVMFNLYPQ